VNFSLYVKNLKKVRHNGNIANTAMEVDQERGAQAGVMEEGEVLQEERVEAHAQILASGTTMAPGFSTNGESTFHEGSRVPVAADHPQQTIPSMMSSMPQNLLGPGKSFIPPTKLAKSVTRN